VWGSLSQSYERFAKSIGICQASTNSRSLFPKTAGKLLTSPVMLPIPGTSSLAHLEENMAAEKLQLTAEEWEEDRRFSAEELRIGLLKSGATGIHLERTP
jgi:hypothetical protein